MGSSAISLLLITTVLGLAFCDGPTFRYITSYDRTGRFITTKDLEKSSVNVLKPIIFIIGGLKPGDGGNGNWSNELESAYVEKQVHNVFVVNWQINPSSPLLTQTREIGLKVAEFVSTIFNKTGEEYLDIHLMGVCLGGEVAASASDVLKNTYNRKVRRITALNPTSYLSTEEVNTFDFTSADFVEVVFGLLSKEISSTVGTIDFYVDGDCNNSCLIKLYAKSINSSDHFAVKCENLEKFENGLCDGQEKVVFGENVDRTAKGKYFLKIAK